MGGKFKGQFEGAAPNNLSQITLFIWTPLKVGSADRKNLFGANSAELGIWKFNREAQRESLEFGETLDVFAKTHSPTLSDDAGSVAPRG